MRPRIFMLALASALALVIAGCGSSGSTTSTPAKTSAAATSTNGGPNPNGPEVSPSGDIPDNQAYVAYKPAAAGYSVKVPEGWGQTATQGGASFTDKLNAIQAQLTTAPGPLTIAQANGTLVPQLASKKGYHAGTVTTVSRTAGPAVRITYLAAGPTDPVTGKSPANAVEQYVFFHKGKRLTLTLSGPKGADNVDPWKIVTNSVRWTS